VEFKIIDKALENLEKNATIRGKWENYIPENKEIDGKVELRFENKERTECFVEVKKEIRNHHIPKLQKLAKEYKPFLLIVDRLYPNLKNKLKEAHVNWLDRAGNIYFNDNQHFVWIDLHTTTPTKEKKNRAFTKTGLKVVFLFLHDEKWLDKTYREIAEKADVALGNIKHVLDGLKQQNFLVAKTKGKYKLINKKKLLDRWITAFTDELKPRLHIDNFEFLNEAEEREWKHLNLEKETFWGGEPGADLLTGNLRPANYTLYTRKTKAALMKEHKLKPNPDGNVEVYNPYWTVDTPNEKVAPPLVVYTDLMTTGDPRNANIAEEIYERFLTHLA